MLGPDFASAVIETRKLTAYLLAEDHPEGGAKAAFFRASGFSEARPEELALALRRQASDAQPTSIVSGFGVKYVVDGPITAPDGRTPLIRTVWIVEIEASSVRFVTAYPLELRRAYR